MELNRRAATGSLSELFGKRTLDSDRLSRTLGFSRLAKTSWKCLLDSAKQDLEAYANGVNAYLASCPKRPLEFKLLNHHPEPWRPLDSVAYGRLQMWALTTGASSELIYAQLIEAVGEEKAAELALFYPPENPITLKNELAELEINQLRLDSMLNTAVSPFLGKGSVNGSGRGCNGWVISPERSQTNHAILANDMHLPVGTPSTWHIQHLQSDDGFKVAGFTQPGLPYVMMGHNEQIAWGATMAYTDGEDLFLEQFDDKRPFHYQHKGQWLEAEQIEEQINIRGRTPHTETVLQTIHGPIISTTLYSDQPTKIALSSVALNPNLTMDGFGLLNEAQNWQQFETAVSRIQAPSLNLLYADQKGNIGHYLTGQVPIRVKGTGTLPNIGWTGEYEWQGVVPFSQMPHAVNPKDGLIISANHKIVSDEFPIFLGNVWRNGYRAKQIEQLLQDKTAVTPQACAHIQQDVFSLAAQHICQHLAHLESESPATQYCLSQLQLWDCHLTLTSTPTTIFQTFIVHLTHVLLAQLPQSLRHSLLGLGPHSNFQPVNDFQGQWLISLLNILANPRSKWLPHPSKEATLLRCLDQTAVTLQNQLGANGEHWQWQHHHHVTFKHALGEQTPLNHLFNVGPIPVGGDGYTILQSSMQPNSVSNHAFSNNAISVSTRMIVDLNNWNQFQLIHAPGQSGHRHHLNYDDLLPLWANGRFVQLPWEKSAILNNVKNSLRLLSQKRSFK